MFFIFKFPGIGRGIAKKLVECGAETIALSRTQADLDSLKAEVKWYMMPFISFTSSFMH